MTPLFRPTHITLCVGQLLRSKKSVSKITRKMNLALKENADNVDGSYRILLACKNWMNLNNGKYRVKQKKDAI